MSARERPPEDIDPEEFFTRWAPEAVARDPDRQAKLRDTEATVAFELSGSPGGTFAVEIDRGTVRGRRAEVEAPDLRVRVDVDTWRALNRGDISAPEALLRRRVKIEGSFILALKLHLILG